MGEPPRITNARVYTSRARYGTVPRLRRSIRYYRSTKSATRTQTESVIIRARQLRRLTRLSLDTSWSWSNSPVIRSSMSACAASYESRYVRFARAIALPPRQTAYPRKCPGVRHCQLYCETWTECDDHLPTDSMAFRGDVPSRKQYRRARRCRYAGSFHPLASPRTQSHA